MNTNTWRGTADLSLRAMRHHLSNARSHDEMRHTTELTTEQWADWMLYVTRAGLGACAPLQNYLAPHLTEAETAEVVAACDELSRFKQAAVTVGGHLLPGDVPPLDD